jgi:integrase
MFNGRQDRSYDICWQEDGKKRWRTLGRLSEGMTADRAHEIRLGILRELKAPRPEPLDPTIEEIARDWLGRREHGRSTISILHTKILPHLGDIRMSGLDRIALHDARDAMLARGLSASTVTSTFATLSHMLQDAREHGLWQGVNPVSKAAGFRYPRVDNGGERFLSEDEAARLLAALIPWWRDAARLTLYTGIRLGEIFNLRVEDTDAANGVVMIRGKGGARQPLLLTPEAAGILTRRIREHPRPDGLIFGRKDSSFFRRTVKRLGFNEGVTDRRKRVWYHTLRHTFASWLVQKGADIYAVQTLMRHRSIKMTQRYAHLSPRVMRDKLQIIRETMGRVQQQPPPPRSRAAAGGPSPTLSAQPAPA